MLTNRTKNEAWSYADQRELEYEDAKKRYKPASSQYKKALGRFKSAKSMVKCFGGWVDLISKIDNEVKRGTLFFCNHSGGKDSQSMFLLLSRLVPKSQLIIIHADLGRVEWDGLQEFIKETTWDEYEFHVVRAVDKEGKEKDLLRSVYERADSLKAKGKKAPPWFSPSQRYCTASFKTGPLEKLMRRLMKERKATRAISCLGIRAEESINRANNVPFELNDNMSKAGRTVYNWLPIFDMKEHGDNGVWDTIHSFAQEGHWAYQKGMSRLSCVFCMMANKKDIGVAARLKPELFAEYVQAEKDLGYTMFSGMTMEQKAGITLKELGL